MLIGNDEETAPQAVKEVTEIMNILLHEASYQALLSRGLFVPSTLKGV